MNSSPSKLDPTPPELESLRQELEAKGALVQDVRRHLIQAQLTILELNDTILVKETEKIDLTSLLGDLERRLEEKLNALQELDRGLNERLATLQQNSAGDRAARDRIIQDLVAKLDDANREIGATHDAAAGFSRGMVQAREQLQHSGQELSATRDALAKCQRELAAVQGQRDATEAARTEVAARIMTIEASLSWKVMAPVRALRRLLA